jgi:hypothetical protein
MAPVTRGSRELGLVLAALTIACAVWLGVSATSFNRELALSTPPLAERSPVIAENPLPRLARRVFVVIVDGLRLDHSALPYLDELRQRGASTVAAAQYPTWSRPSYVTILTGAPPAASGVRTNHVPWAVTLDTLMDRARAAGLRVAQASDIGMLPPLFLRGDRVPLPIRGIEYAMTDDVVHPPPGMQWPFDDVRKASSLADLARSISALVSGDAELVLVLAGDVDRAGHAHGGASEAYAAAARRVDAALRDALAGVDLRRDAIVVTSDHGHSARGGHGGDEPEVIRVPIIIAGSGAARGPRVTLARLVDVAPTVAALLGIPAPGHGLGRTLVELLELPPRTARFRLGVDRFRADVLAPPERPDNPDPLWLVIVIAALATTITVAYLGSRARAIAITRSSWLGGTAFVVVVIALAAITRGQLSPSSVPMLYRFERLVAISAAVAIALQLVIARRVIRGELARANGLVLCGVAPSLIVIGSVRAWFAPLISTCPHRTGWSRSQASSSRPRAAARRSRS